MSKSNAIILVGAILFLSRGYGGEKSLVSLKNFCDTELKFAGIDVLRSTTFHIKALGAGGDYGWTYKSNEMFAHGWIINADTRGVVWEMELDNTSKSKGEREFDDNVTLKPGSYEVYFTVPTFTYHTSLTHVNINIDHRQKPLFGSHGKKGKDFFGFFKNWWSDDIGNDWEKRCDYWGIELLVDESLSRNVRTFTPPKELPSSVLKVIGLGDDQLVKQGFAVSEQTAVQVYALGESSGEYEMGDYAWIVNTADRARVWEMQYRKRSRAGGAEKNIEYTDEVTLPKGEYVLYCLTDDSHSKSDWNAAPPYDPLNWGVTLSVKNERDRKNIKTFQYKEDQNVIVALTKIGDNEHRSEGFTLKDDTAVRIYAFGERGNSRRSMADYAVIVDVKTRDKVWTMDVDRSLYAGGASKNRYVDEVIMLPKGSYIVTYNTDDSHAYDEWNAAAPFDPEHYGITLMGTGEKFTGTVVTKYVAQQDKNIIAQIIRVADGADENQQFKLNKTTRIRIFAMGEGQNREMYDYGWIEDTRTGTIVWEMTYSMTFHAGGGRKNRVVNTTIVLDKGEYKLRYTSDDSHSYDDWNVDPPEDPEYWGITLFRDDTPERVMSPKSPLPPEKPFE